MLGTLPPTPLSPLEKRPLPCAEPPPSKPWCKWSVAAIVPVHDQTNQSTLHSTICHCNPTWLTSFTETTGKTKTVTYRTILAQRPSRVIVNINSNNRTVRNKLHTCASSMPSKGEVYGSNCGQQLGSVIIKKNSSRTPSFL